MPLNTISIVLSRCQDVYPYHVCRRTAASDDTSLMGKLGIGIRCRQSPTVPVGAVAGLGPVDSGMWAVDAAGPGHERGALGLRANAPRYRDRHTVHAADPVYPSEHRVRNLHHHCVAPTFGRPPYKLLTKKQTSVQWARGGLLLLYPCFWVGRRRRGLGRHIPEYVQA